MNTPKDSYHTRTHSLSHNTHTHTGVRNRYRQGGGEPSSLVYMTHLHRTLYKFQELAHTFVRRFLLLAQNLEQNVL